MDVAKEIRAEADRLHQLARDIESSRNEAEGFTIEVRNPAGKIVVSWDVTRLEKTADPKAVRYVAGWRGSKDPNESVYARVAGLGAGVL